MAPMTCRCCWRPVSASPFAPSRRSPPPRGCGSTTPISPPCSTPRAIARVRSCGLLFGDDDDALHVLMLVAAEIVAVEQKAAGLVRDDPDLHRRVREHVGAQPERR